MSNAFPFTVVRLGADGFNTEPCVVIVLQAVALCCSADSRSGVRAAFVVGKPC